MVLLSELTAKRSRPKVFLTGCDELDEELSYIRQVYSHSSMSLTPSSQHRFPSSPRVFTQQKGIPWNSCCEISGPSTCGKTTLWLSLVIDALKMGFRVLYISGNYSKFPLERALKIDGFNKERHPKQIDQVYINYFEQLAYFLASLDPKTYGIIVINHYDSLVPNYWDFEKQTKAYKTILKLMVKISEQSCIIATCGVRRRLTTQDGGCSLTTPMSPIDSHTNTVVRYRICKYLNNISVFDSGFHFGPHTTSGVHIPALPAGVSISPEKHGPFSQRRNISLKNAYMTPSSRSIKRRNSFTSPRKARKMDTLSQTCSPRRTTSNADELPIEISVLEPNIKNEIKEVKSEDITSASMSTTVDDNATTTTDIMTGTTVDTTADTTANTTVNTTNITSVEPSTPIKKLEADPTIIQNSQLEYDDSPYLLKIAPSN